MFDSLAVLGLVPMLSLADATPIPSMGLCCPRCQSASVRCDGPLEFDRYAAARYLRCESCRNVWTDLFDWGACPA
jgi:hypothetical protein